jgi:hypothetical protein
VVGANGVTVSTSASTTVIASSVAAASSFLHLVDGTVAVVVAAGVAVTESYVVFDQFIMSLPFPLGCSTHHRRCHFRVRDRHEHHLGAR